MPAKVTSQAFAAVFDDPELKPATGSNEYRLIRDWMSPKELLVEPPEDVQSALATTQHMGDLVYQYMDDVRSHFFLFAKPILDNLVHTKPFTVNEVSRLVTTLADLKRHYFYPFRFAHVHESLLAQFELCYFSLLNITLTPPVFELCVVTFLDNNKLCNPSSSLLSAIADFRDLKRDFLLDQLILKRLLEDIEFDIRQKYSKKWSESVMEPLKVWTLEVAIPSGCSLLPTHVDDTSSIISAFAVEVLAKLRTEELFDIVVDFPDSRPGLEDLRVRQFTST